MTNKDIFYLLSHAISFNLFIKGLISFEEYIEVDNKNKSSFIS